MFSCRQARTEWGPKNRLKILFGILLLSWSAHAQTSRASISGIITDSSGSAVADAKVTVTDLARGGVYRVQTNQAGSYLVSELIPGAYSISVEKSGFETYKVDSFALSTQQSAVLNIAMQIGSVTQTMEVKSEVQMIDPSSAALSGVVENKKIVDLPLNNRNVFSLLTLVPGVAPSAPAGQLQSDFFTDAVRFSVNGGLESTSDVQLDGISAVSQSDIPGIQAVSALPSIESIQEFRIQTNAYSAEYGRSGGGVVTMVTKSGTNGFHGDLFEFLRNNAFDANNYFANASSQALPPLQQSQFGASLGGPVIKNKTFFFIVYEGKRLNEGSFGQYTVPTALERQGNFSQDLNANGQLQTIYNPFSTRVDANNPSGYTRDPFAGNMVPANMIDPVAAKALTYYPQPNTAGLPFTHQNNLSIFSSVLFPTDRIDFRVDHNFSETKRFFTRYNYIKNQSGDLNSWNSPATPTNGLMTWDSHDAVVDYTQTFGSSTVLDLRGGMNRFVASRPSYGYGFDLTTLGLPADIKAYAQQGGELLFPNFNVQDYSSLGPTGGAYYTSANTRYNGLASLSRVFGKQTVKVGGDIRFFYLNFFQYGSAFSESFSRNMTQGPDALTPSNVAGDGFASFLLGTGDSGSSSYAVKPANANRYYAGYLQDDIKLTSKLTLNAGFRIEAETGTTERHNQLTAIDPSALNPISQQVGFNVTGGYLFAGGSLGGRAIRGLEWKPNPRIGLAYQVNAKTVIRSGYGIFYGITHTGATDAYTGSPYSTATPVLATLDSVTPNALLNNPYPQGFTYPQGAAAGLASGVGTTLQSGWPQALRTPYNQQWNFSIQRELGSGTLLQVAYAGNKGTHLGAFECCGTTPNMDQLSPSLVNAQNGLLQLVNNPFYGTITTGTLSQPQVQRGQLLLPYPEWTAVLPSNSAWGDSSYHSLQVFFQKRFGSGTSITASYTWSKMMSDIADGRWNDATVNSAGEIRSWYCFSCEKAVSSYDVPHRLVVNFTYELPFGRGKRFGAGWNGVTNLLLGGWQTNGILTLASGQPLSISVAQNTSFSFGGGQHADYTGIDPNLGGQQSISEWFNTASFAQPANYTFGTLGRTLTAVRGDWLKNMDFSLFKNFNIKERFNLEFRAEAFNLSNTVVYGNPNTSLGSNSFGVVTSQANSPRQIQLGLKLLF